MGRPARPRRRQNPSASRAPFGLGGAQSWFHSVREQVCGESRPSQEWSPDGHALTSRCRHQLHSEWQHAPARAGGVRGAALLRRRAQARCDLPHISPRSCRHPVRDQVTMDPHPNPDPHPQPNPMQASCTRPSPWTKPARMRHAKGFAPTAWTRCSTPSCSRRSGGGFPARAVHIDADRPTVMVRDLNGNVWRLVPSA